MSVLGVRLRVERVGHGVRVCPSREILPKRLPSSHSQLGVSARGSTPSPTRGVLGVCISDVWPVRGGVSLGMPFASSWEGLTWMPLHTLLPVWLFLGNASSDLMPVFSG